jgi:acyl-coenzyme A thioesterase PaaI-like protein
MRASERVLSVEFKVNPLRPGRGETFLAVGKVGKGGADAAAEAAGR